MTLGQWKGGEQGPSRKNYRIGMPWPRGIDREGSEEKPYPEEDSLDWDSHEGYEQAER
jgi:hypothetical protein